MFLDPSYFWIVVGVIILVLELITMSVFLLFIGFAALTLGVLMFFDIITQEQDLLQVIIFFTSVIFWYIVLSFSLKKLKLRKIKNGEKNILDQRAEVISVIGKQKIGKVRWSGTKMKAILSKNNLSQKVEKGSIVRIISVDGDLLTVSNNH
jgi:membrane protein implicated in regulation of membrane protease activity